MAEIDPKIIRERYKNLPPDLKDAIFSEEVTEKIMNISNKYGLYVDEMGELGNEIGRVMLGITHPKDFIRNLMSRLEVDAEKARAIAKDVNEQIFAKVKESLKKLHKIEEEEEIGEVEPAKRAETEPKETTEQKPIEEKEIPKGIQRAPKQVREIQAEEIEQAKKESKYPGEADPYREPIE